MSIFDLHMHSNISRDGTYTPEELIQIAKNSGLKVVALSDHNDMHGIDRMIEAGKNENIQVIPAIEFDTLFEGLEVHLLGYNFDYNQPYYQNLGEYTLNLIDSATVERVELFKKNYGVDLDAQAILKEADEKGENPYFIAFDTMISDPRNKDIPAFQDYMPGGKRSNPAKVNFYWDNCSVGSPNYVEVIFPDFKETVERIHKDGGITVLAHPFKNFYLKDELLLKAIEAGVDGIEAYSNYHDEKMNAYYDDFCAKHNVLMTCGSDFHGALKPKIKMGEYGYNKGKDQEILDTFLQYLKK